MGYLIIGAIITFVGLGFIVNEISFLGVIISLIGIALGIKGRGKIDNPGR